MSDYTDLQKAAECAAQDTIKFADEEEEMRALQQFHEDVDPETVLALIAENQAMAGLLQRFVDGEHEHEENQAERHMYFTEAQSLLALMNGELEAHTIVPDSAIKAIHAERDQLKAENEALRKYGEEFAVLAERRREEVEALRKERDARHPFKPSNEPAIGYSDGCMVCGQWGGHFGLPCPKTRATADAAMGNGEQS